MPYGTPMTMNMPYGIQMGYFGGGGYPSYPGMGYGQYWPPHHHHHGPHHHHHHGHHGHHHHHHQPWYGGGGGYGYPMQGYRDEQMGPFEQPFEQPFDQSVQAFEDYSVPSFDYQQGMQPSVYY